MFWQNLESDDRLSSVFPKNEMNRHVPVLLPEVLSYLNCQSNKNYLDLTLGGGGHAEAILNSTAPDGQLVGADRDQDALELSASRLAPFGRRFKAIQGSLLEVDQVLAQCPNLRFDGALIDCGVSSNQLERPHRGFSFQHEGPLDMRMDRASGFTAAEWLYTATEKEIADTLYIYGQERRSRRIAKAIVFARKENRLKTTKDLSDIVRASVPKEARYGRLHPATRTFQAIRILVNDELTQLRHAIGRLLAVLPVAARIVVISFHSLEDQIVKDLFRKAHQLGRTRTITKKPVIASEAEHERNPRTRSAKLRATEIVMGSA